MVGSLLPQARRLGRLPTTIILLSLTATTIGCCGAQHSAGDFLYKDGATRDGGVDHSNGPTLIYNTAAFGKGLRLVDEGAGVEQLAVTENDVQYLGLTCAAGTSECVPKSIGLVETLSRREKSVCIEECTLLLENEGSSRFYSNAEPASTIMTTRASRPD